MSTATKAPKAPVLDAKGNELELGMKVFYDEKAQGSVMGLEHQRGRAVIQPADGSKPVVRPASKVRVEKNKSGKIQRVERAVRAARKAVTPANA